MGGLFLNVRLSCLLSSLRRSSGWRRRLRNWGSSWRKSWGWAAQTWRATLGTTDASPGRSASDIRTCKYTHFILQLLHENVIIFKNASHYLCYLGLHKKELWIKDVFNFHTLSSDNVERISSGHYALLLMQHTAGNSVFQCWTYWLFNV